jgi:hypothetical protein
MNSVWSIAGEKAILNASHLAARLDLNRPELGLTEFIIDGVVVAQCHPLRLLFPSGGAPMTSTDFYVRAHDLVVSYSPNRDELTSQAYYRYVDLGSHGAGIDLILSRQTELLDADPRTIVSSLLPLGETLIFDGQRFDTEEVSVGESVNLDTGLYVHRFENRDVTFVEMIHPTDFEESVLTRSLNTLHVDHTLFHHRLEKGVIRRGQLRCAFVERESDLIIAQQLFEQFLQAELPLTT